MTTPFTVAIIGSGPAGLSAAAHAAKLGISHILLESQAHLADTIYKYQKGKHVMAEPGFLDLRSPISFVAGTRESILNKWDDEVAVLGTVIQNKAAVNAIQGQKGRFWIALDTNELILAEQIVLAIGMQGNLRTLGVPGENLPNIQYQLDDPRAFGGESHGTDGVVFVQPDGGVVPRSGPCAGEVPGASVVPPEEGTFVR